MKIIVSTCDKYDCLLPGMARQFNKHWYDKEQIVDVIGFRTPPKLPSNFVFHSLGEDTGKWTDPRIPFFNALDDEPFIFALEDYWLTHDVSREAVEMMQSFLDGGAVKADLSTNTSYFDNVQIGDFYKAKPRAQYRTSMQPAIWTKRYFMDLCGPGLTPWEFELQNTPKMKEGDIIGSSFQIFKYANVVLKGAPFWDRLDSISAFDMYELVKAGEMEWVLGSFN